MGRRMVVWLVSFSFLSICALSSAMRFGVVLRNARTRSIFELLSELKLTYCTAAAPAPAAANEDEIDWDEDDSKTAPAPATSTTTEAPPAAAPTSTEPAATTTEEPAGPAEPAVPEVPKIDFTAGLTASSAQTELEKRAARAKRFQKKTDVEAGEGDKADEAAKLAERLKKFGPPKEAEQKMVATLDSALSERRGGKRGREGGDKLEVKDEGRERKRQTPDRRVEGGGGRGGRGGRGARGTGHPVAERQGKKVTDDPTEKAKAEARAKRFQKQPTAAAE